MLLPAPHRIASCAVLSSMSTQRGGDPDGLPLRVRLQRCCKWSVSWEAFIIPSARTSSVVSLQLPSLRLFNLQTRCICSVIDWRVPPTKSFQEISSFSKSGREGSKATRHEQKKIQIGICNLWCVVNRIHCLHAQDTVLHCKRIEGPWVCGLAAKQGSLSLAIGETRTVPFPISWGGFPFLPKNSILKMQWCLHKITWDFLHCHGSGNPTITVTVKCI